MKDGASAFNFFEDVLGLGCPGESFRIRIMMVDIVHDRFHQLWNTGERSPADTFIGQVPEPSFDQIQPRTAGRNEVHMEARMTLEPLLDLGVLVRCVVVGDEMDIELLGDGRLDVAQELQKLLVAVPALALRENLPGGDVESRE